MRSKPFSITLIDKHSITIPEAIGKIFTEKKQKRVKVEASNKGEKITFHAALKKLKTGAFNMYFSSEKQKLLNISIGDTFKLELFKDESKYGVEVPEALDAVLLSDYDAFQIFEALTPGKQRSIIYTIKRIKNVQKQVDKSILMTENLKRGIKDLKLLFKHN